jgi:phosphopantothenate synthetase
MSTPGLGGFIPPPQIPSDHNAQPIGIDQNDSIESANTNEPSLKQRTEEISISRFMQVQSAVMSLKDRAFKAFKNIKESVIKAHDNLAKLKSDYKYKLEKKLKPEGEALSQPMTLEEQLADLASGRNIRTPDGIARKDVVILSQKHGTSNADVMTRTGRFAQNFLNPQTSTATKTPKVPGPNVDDDIIAEVNEEMLDMYKNIDDYMQTDED